MNNCVNFDVVFIKWYLRRRMTECSCRLLPNAFWFLNLTSLALFSSGYFPRPSFFLFFFLSVFLLFRLEICTLNPAPLWLSLCAFKYDYLMKLYWNWPNNSSSSKERHSSAIIKSAHSAPLRFSSLSFARSLSRSGHLFTSIISWNLFVCWGLFVLSVDGVVIFCFRFFDFQIFMHTSKSIIPLQIQRWL